MKSLAKKAHFFEGSAKVMKAYKAKVAGLTLENADMRAQMESLAKTVEKHKYDLKHTLTVKARAEEREQKARDELRAAKEELSRASQEASNAQHSLEHLTDECNSLRDGLQRQEVVVNQKEGAIAELRDEACTLWASGWVAFQHKASKVFPDLDFNFPISTREESEQSDFNNEGDVEVFPSASSSSLPLDDPKAEDPASEASQDPSLET